MKKLSIIALLITATPLMAEHSVSVYNNASRTAQAAVINNQTDAVERSITIEPASRARFKLDSKQDVRITIGRNTKTIKALPDTMMIDRSGKNRPLMQGYHVTIENGDNISWAMFQE